MTIFTIHFSFEATAPIGAAQPPLIKNHADWSADEALDVAVIPKEQEPEVLPPPLYQVLMLNDDFTPMEFVVYALQTFFNKDHETAVQIMLNIHTRGRGVCGIYPRDIASTKVSLVMDAAKEAGHPLQLVSEPIA